MLLAAELGKRRAGRAGVCRATLKASQREVSGQHLSMQNAARSYSRTKWYLESHLLTSRPVMLPRVLSGVQSGSGGSNPV